MVKIQVIVAVATLALADGFSFQQVRSNANVSLMTMSNQAPTLVETVHLSFGDDRLSH